MSKQTAVPYAEDPLMQEALTYVYIAQFVRPDGPRRAGVLGEDCQKYDSQIKKLLYIGDIQSAHCAGHDGLITTPPGFQKAKTIIDNRILTHQKEIETEFSTIPRRFLQYIQGILFSKNQSNDCEYRCLLSDINVGGLSKRLLGFLTTIDLTVIARWYAVGGKPSDKDTYLPAPELVSFFRTYLAKDVPLWTEELKQMHIAFHVLDSVDSITLEEINRKVPMHQREKFKKFIDECIKSGTLIQSYTGFTAGDKMAFDDERAKLFQKPLIDFLLEQNDPVIKPIKPIDSKVEGTDKGQESPIVDPYIATSNSIKIGNQDDHGQHGILGRVDNRDVVLDLFMPHAITVLGVQGSGKSYSAGAIIEMAARAIPGISTVTKPLSCIIFHFANEENKVPEWIGLASKNSSPSQTEKLKVEYAAIPEGIPKANFNILVPPTKLSDRQKEYSGFKVMPLAFSPSKLKADDWLRLLTFGKGSDTLYMEALRELIIDLREKKPNFGTDDMKNEIEKSDLGPNQKKLVNQRIKTIGRWLSQDGEPFVDLLKPGMVNIVDLRDPLAVNEEMAALLLQTTFSFVKDRPQDGICLVAIDEAHLFFEHDQLTKDIIAFVAQLRHNFRVYLLLMSQLPGRFHPNILALSDVIICYRLDSDTELDFLKKNQPAFADVTKEIKKLKTGDGKAFLWARESTDNFLAKPRLISIRPKVTEDRGKTATAF